jgi:hypothetical protein
VFDPFADFVLFTFLFVLFTALLITLFDALLMVLNVGISGISILGTGTSPPVKNAKMK